MSETRQGDHAIRGVIAFDIETNGPDMTRNSILEIGAAFWEIGKRGPTSTLMLQVEELPGRQWNESTWNFYQTPAKLSNGVQLEQTLYELMMQSRAYNVLAPEVAMPRLVSWVRNLRLEDGSSDGIVVVFDTVNFDAAFISLYLSMFAMSGPPPTRCPSVDYLFGPTTYRTCRDTNSFYFGVARQLKSRGSEDAALAALELAEFPPWITDFQATHRADDDAREIGGQFVWLLEVLANPAGVSAAIDEYKRIKSEHDAAKEELNARVDAQMRNMNTEGYDNTENAKRIDELTKILVAAEHELGVPPSSSIFEVTRMIANLKRAYPEKE